MRTSALGLCALLAACSLGLNREAPQKQQFVLAPEPGEAQPPVGDAVLELRPVYVHRTWAGRGFVTVGEAGAVEAAFYEEWFVPPAEAVHDSLLAWLDRCSGARAVVPAGTRLDVTHRLECDVRQVGVVVREAGPVGIVAIRAILLAEGGSVQQEFRAETPLEADTAAAHAAAVRRSLATVLAELCAWVRTKLAA